MHRRTPRHHLLALGLILLGAAAPWIAKAQPNPAAPLHEADFIIENFKFNSGESLPSLRIHYTTVGAPHRNADGVVDNAVLLLHSRGGVAKAFLAPDFDGALFRSGGLLDAGKYYLVMPDTIGAGQSSKPSDGLRNEFPHFDYDDMVRAQFELVTKELKVNHLRLILGTSLGCGQAFLWGEKYPDFTDALMPMSCQAGKQPARTRLMVQVTDDFIRNDPDFKGGAYTVQPQMAIRSIVGLMSMIGETPIHLEEALPTPPEAPAMGPDVEKFLAASYTRAAAAFDANDYLYLNDAVRDFNTEAKLGDIRAYVMWVNAADDFVNPDVGIADADAKKLKHGRLVVLPASAQTHGHVSYRFPNLWSSYLEELLRESAGGLH